MKLANRLGVLFSFMALVAGCANDVAPGDVVDGGVVRASDDGGSCLPTAGASCSASDPCCPGLECVPNSGANGGHCAGTTGAVCRQDGDCVSAQCVGPTDCHDSACAAQPHHCVATQTPGACLSDDDCNSGHCRDPQPYVAAGSCCSSMNQQCTGDSECCAGLVCHTDNSGCGVGPTPVCVIDGVTYMNGASNPADPECQYCDTHASTTSWTDLGSYARCNHGADGYYCCHGACTNSACE